MVDKFIAVFPSRINVFIKFIAVCSLPIEASECSDVTKTVVIKVKWGEVTIAKSINQ